VQLWIQALDSIETCAGKLARRDPLPAQIGEQFGGGAVDQGCGSVSMTGGTLKNPSS
jgi:hypothetical protein